ncbi:hypothetical protein CRE_06500 [Caenorhabditis remanei]|uniref:Uncharacterized protein n=1 Tax=Caenorhabditis remanei TaxID=31234 RepID=E3M167_CAERE|nr:hypothetical protein CRE_06500 [Caenorhabditis remanei]
MSQSTNSNVDTGIIIIGEVPAAPSAQGTFAVPIGPIRSNIARGRGNQVVRSRQYAHTGSPRTRGTGMAPYNYAAIQAAQTCQAQEAALRRQCEEDTAHYKQEILKLKPQIEEVQGRVDEYNEKFVEDVEKDKVLLGNYKKRLEDHSEKLEEFIKKEYLELNVKVAETSNQEGLKNDLKELERLQKLRKMLAENPHEPVPDSNSHDVKQIRQTLNKFGFGTKMTQDLEELRKAIATKAFFSKTGEQKEVENETATSFEQGVEICGSLGHKLGGIDLTPWLFNVKGLNVIPQIVMTAPKHGEKAYETLRKEKSPWTDLTSRVKCEWNRRAGYIQAFQAEQEVRGLVLPMSAVVKEMGETMAEKMREEEEEEETMDTV